MGSELSTEGTFKDTNYEMNINFVIVAMTEEEASRLIDGNALDRSSVSSDEKSAFDKFYAVLANEHKFADLNNRFGHQREEWKPNQGSDQPIIEIVRTICREFSDTETSCKGLIINPCFLSSDFFEKENDKIRRDTWDKINEQGGVMIVDALSLYHPDVAVPFFQSGAGFNKKVAVLVHSPVNLLAGEINKLITDFFASISSKYKRIHDRFDANCDKLCEIGVGDPCNFRRWLFSALLYFISNNAMISVNHEILTEVVGEKHGMGINIFTGGKR